MRLAEAVAKNLERLRKEKSLSQDALATQVGVSRQTIWSYEKGEGKFSLDTISKLASTLGVAETDLTTDPGLVAYKTMGSRAFRHLFKHGVLSKDDPIFKDVALIGLSSVLDILGPLEPTERLSPEFMEHFRDAVRERAAQAESKVPSATPAALLADPEGQEDPLRPEVRMLAEQINRLDPEAFETVRQVIETFAIAEEKIAAEKRRKKGKGEAG